MLSSKSPDHGPEALFHVSQTFDELNVALDCWYEVIPAERGAREYGTGLQLDPDYPMTVSLVHAYLPASNVDITPVMSQSVIDYLEEDAYVRFGDQE